MTLPKKQTFLFGGVWIISFNARLASWTFSIFIVELKITEKFYHIPDET